jgi:hypothetical protein
MVVLAALVAAVFAAQPLDDWAADTLTDPQFAPLRQVIDDWRDIAGRIGLDRPYASIRSAVRALEAARF